MDDRCALRNADQMANHAILMQFGTRVRSLRQAKGYSQEAFAAVADIDRGTFGKLERGEINVGLVSVARIAVGLEMKLDELLNGVELDPDEIRGIPRSAKGPRPIGSRNSS